MRIDEIKINSYGKLKNKELSLKEGINIIYGENEKGKSTLLNYIVNMLYGTSKNKRGRDISDYEKYKPWDTEEFSGKIVYTLDNNEKYEVYREFGKKNPKIYNSRMEDISKNFSIDKNTGNQFFYEQTNVDEQTFSSTVVSFQNEVEIDNQTQNILIQKIANTSSTGDDRISYQKALDKLNKKQLDEIGTSRSQGKPINIVMSEINRLTAENNELKKYEDYKFEIEEKQSNLKEQVKFLNLQYDAMKELNALKQEEDIEKSKLAFNEKRIDEIEEQIQNLYLQRDKIISEKKAVSDSKLQKSNIYKYLIISSIFIILSIIIAVIVKPVFCIITLFIAIMVSVIGFVKNKKNKNQNIIAEKKKRDIQLYNQEIEKKVYEINAQINLLDQNQKIQINETERIKNEVLKNIKYKCENAIYRHKEKLGEHGIQKVVNLSNIQQELELIQNSINNFNMEIHKLNIDKDNILSKIDLLAENEEKLAHNKEQFEILNKKNESINLAKELIEVAYQKMKDNVTPKFTKNLSENISEITDNKYNKIIINEENGIMVELPNGDYKKLERFSTGTIQQLYLSFRISMLDNISDENLPILFDEVFAYYDDTRLRDTINHIYKKYSNDHQIILFTCTNREELICKELDIKYNKISL